VKRNYPKNVLDNVNKTSDRLLTIRRLIRQDFFASLNVSYSMRFFYIFSLKTFDDNDDDDDDDDDDDNDDVSVDESEKSSHEFTHLQ
jgi:hypothetical protein